MAIRAILDIKGTIIINYFFRLMKTHGFVTNKNFVLNLATNHTNQIKFGFLLFFVFCFSDSL